MFKKKSVKSDSVVLVIDMQDRFLNRLREGERERIIPNQVLVLEECSRLNIPVILIEYVSGDSTVDEIKTVLKDTPFYIVTKEWDDAFTNPTLDKLLKTLGAKKLVLMGINADFCVLRTARSALTKGYQIITSNDVMSGMPHHSWDNSSGWYQENGLWVHNAKSLTLNLA